MTFIRLLLMGMAFACFAMHAMNISLPKGNFIGYGLAFWTLAEIIKMP